MGSKTYIILFGLSLAIGLLVISDVSSARDLAETSSEKDNVAATIDGHGGGGGGCSHGWCGHHCCNYAGEAADAEVAHTETTTSEDNNVADTESKYQGGGGGWQQGGGGGGWQGGGGCRRWCGRHCC